MNRHQVLTGAANYYDYSVSIGSVENNYFTAYGSGRSLVILSSNFERVQVILGSKLTNSMLRCVECTVDTGKIAAAYDNFVHIFEPTPSVKKASHNIHYKWIQVGSIELDSAAVCLSWHCDSNQLLIGCASGQVQIWSYNPNSNNFFNESTCKNESTSAAAAAAAAAAETLNKSSSSSSSKPHRPIFSIYDDSEAPKDNTKHRIVEEEDDGGLSSSVPIFKKIWETKLANPVKCLQYSPDGSLFVSFGENDRLVKVWYEVKQINQLVQLNDESFVGHNRIEYNYVYLAHPRAVIGVQWRRISKFMPRGMVANSLLTSCRDNVCRIWSETVLPDDGLVQNNQEEVTYDNLNKSAGHKRKLLNKLHKMRLHPHFPHLPHFKTPFSHDQTAKKEDVSLISFVSFPQYQSPAGGVGGPMTPGAHHGAAYVQNHLHQLNEAHPYNHYNQPSLNPNQHHYSNHHFHHHAPSSPAVPPPPASATNASLATTPATAGSNSLSPNPRPSANLLATPNASLASPNMLTSSSSINLAAAAGSGDHSASMRMMHNSQSCHELYLKHTHGHGSAHHGAMQNSNSFHFHLAGFIDPEAGIPLQPSISQAKGVPFVVHWMNNKDFHFTYAAELFSREIYERIRDKIKAERRRERNGGLNAADSDAELDHDSDNEDAQSNNLSLNKTSGGADDISIVTDDGTSSSANANAVLGGFTNSSVDELIDEFDAFLTGLVSDEEAKNLLFGQAIDHKLDIMLKDWYSSHDMLFCIHPVDGSVLIWLVDWLDEYMPGCYRQAQISFHAKLPNTIPVGDAVSLTNSVFLYSEPIKGSFVDLEHYLTANEKARKKAASLDDYKTTASSSSTSGCQMTSDVNRYLTSNRYYQTSGIVNMVSKHNNGTLNLWQLHFQETSKYQLLINVKHLNRICGHRYRVNDITSHPILPFLLTNSCDNFKLLGEEANSVAPERRRDFEKGLIIWGVEPVGPLSQSGGGIYELARVDSNKEKAFENIAWFPCFLPSSTLGTSSSSPSTLFVSSDASCITIYQAVFDARTLLQESGKQNLQSQHSHDKLARASAPATAESTAAKLQTMVSVSSTYSNTTDIPFDSFNVVSIQSTARPGCIIELEKLADSYDNWTKADLFHVYQEGLIRNVPPTPATSDKTGASGVFSEVYFLILLEKKKRQCEDGVSRLVEIIHMWKVTVTSQPVSSFLDENSRQLPDSPISNASQHKNRLTISSDRVCRQELKLPDDVHVVCANSAAADLSSSSNNFTLSQVPYLFATACSDGIVRFWSCKEIKREPKAASSFSLSNYDEQFVFFEWELNLSSKVSALSSTNVLSSFVTSNKSQVNIHHYPLAISCSYNGRFAVAFKKNATEKELLLHDQQQAAGDADEAAFMNFCVRIYECESTGGSEWKLEDCIHLKNIVLPEIDSGINFDYIVGNQKPIRPSRSSNSFKSIVFNTNPAASAAAANVNASGQPTLSSVPSASFVNISMHNLNGAAGSGSGGGAGAGSGLPPVPTNSQLNHLANEGAPKSPEIPSTIAKMSIRKQYLLNNKAAQAHKSAASKMDKYEQYKKYLIKLDWASTENGSHILTIGLGNQVFVLSCIKKHESLIEAAAAASPGTPAGAGQQERKSSMQIRTNYLAAAAAASKQLNSSLGGGGGGAARSGQQANSSIAECNEEECLPSIRDSLVKWKQFRSFELDSADDMQALPTQIKWVREGLLVIGLSTEMQVYSQWAPFINKCHQVTHRGGLSNPTKALADKMDASIAAFGHDKSSRGSVMMVPKNPSVLDLNKLNKLAKETLSKKPNTGNFKTTTSKLDELDEADEESHETSGKRAGGDDNNTMAIIKDIGLFMQSKSEWPVLPRYHPKQLLELMNSGKINRVKAILMHLTRCIIDCELSQKSLTDAQKKLQRKMSVCSQSEIPGEHVSATLEIDSIPPLPLFALIEADNDGTGDETGAAGGRRNLSQKKSTAPEEIEDAFDVFDVTKPKKSTFGDEEYTFGFDNDDDEFEDEAIKAKKREKRLQKENYEFKKSLLTNLSSDSSANHFNPRVCKLLIDYLTKVRLTNLTDLDQLYLIALADTVANVKCDVTFSQSEDLFSKKEHQLNKKNPSASDPASAVGHDEGLSQTVDNCGLKFLLALRCYKYLMRTLPTANREKLREIGLGTFNFAWAYHSECEQELLNAIINDPTNNAIAAASKGPDANSLLAADGDKSATASANLTWADLKQYGVGWWLKNSTLLRQLIEKVAKYSFQLKNDPLDAALFYLAMKKKGVLWGLFKTVKDTRMADFFKNDFADARWQSSALKNAFALLGKQRFEHAAAFFLLAGKLKDAVEVCIRNLHDLQLAIVIVRLYETDVDQMSNYVRTILSTEILGHSITAVSETNIFGTLSAAPDPASVSSDPFLRSLSFWFLKDYKNALYTLYDVDFNGTNKRVPRGGNGEGSGGEAGERAGSGFYKGSAISHVFNFYTFLKHHPLILRHQMVYESASAANAAASKSDMFIITQIERRLHFVAAYYHLINGCPLLTLDVMTKLPKYLTVDDGQSEADEAGATPTPTEAKDAVDWASATAPAAPKKVEKADDFDWSAPTTGFGGGGGGRFAEEKLELDWGDDDDDDEDEDSSEDEKEKKAAAAATEKAKELEKAGQEVDAAVKTGMPAKSSSNEPADANKVVDLFAQQIKFISCLKILIEEMSMLATGFEVLGGQLRYYMYFWLERETQVLKELCDYNNSPGDPSIHPSLISGSVDPSAGDCCDVSGDEGGAGSQPVSLLHEQVINDQKTFQAKIQRLANRKEWLRSNELLLRTFLSYCSLHCANGSGLTSVKMELVLLMQELVEDRSMKQLLSPVPIPTTIPILSACVASSKNVVAAPIRMLKGLTSDILQTISDLDQIPCLLDCSLAITTLKDSAISLSACIYQCLCDSDVFNAAASNDGMQGFSKNFLYRSCFLLNDSIKQNSIKSGSTLGSAAVSGPHAKFVLEQLRIDSSPKNWPGVSSLTKLLEREQDLEAPKLKNLLFESLVAIYASLLLNALAYYDASTLWRLLSQQWNNQMWNKLFGGGCVTQFKYKTLSNIMADDENAKQRMKMNARLGHRLNSISTSPSQVGGSSGGAGGEEKVYTREQFVPPEVSMINFFMTKPERDERTNGTGLPDENDYDSDDETVYHSRKDVLDEDPEVIHGQRYTEHVNPKSYSWCLMRYAVIKLSIYNINQFLPVVGIEPHELATSSPLIHEVLETFEHWLDVLKLQLNTFGGAPENYIPGCSTVGSQQSNLALTGPKILKYQSILDPANTPFINDKSTYPIRRLWHFLVTKKFLHDLFIRYIFKKSPAAIASQQSQTAVVEGTKKADAGNVNPASEVNGTANPSSIKIIHKDQEGIHSFCLNERDKNMLALCTNKEIIEIDIKNLLTKEAYIDDECEMDILALQSTRLAYEPDVYVVTNRTDASNGPSETVQPGQPAGQAPRSSSSNVILKRSIKEVRRLASHPTLPYYLSGTNESIVKLWHWGSSDALSSYKQNEKLSSAAKISKISFNTHGNKFGVADMDGYLHLYQLLGCSFKSYMTLRCHKVINDFLFLDSSSLLLTIGTSNDSYVLSIWDTLLPASKALIKTYKEPDIPSGTCAAYSALNHLAYCGNRKGEINIYDVRAHKKIQKLTAHESSVKALALDPDEYYLATGSSEGNIKIWNLRSLEPVQIYHNEHSKSSLIRSFNSGVNQLYFTNDNQLLSCGTDGTLVIRNLPPRS